MYILLRAFVFLYQTQSLILHSIPNPFLYLLGISSQKHNSHQLGKAVRNLTLWLLPFRATAFTKPLLASETSVCAPLWTPIACLMLHCKHIRVSLIPSSWCSTGRAKNNNEQPSNRVCATIPLVDIDTVECGGGEGEGGVRMYTKTKARLLSFVVFWQYYFTLLLIRRHIGRRCWQPFSNQRFIDLSHAAIYSVDSTQNVARAILRETAVTHKSTAIFHSTMSWGSCYPQHAEKTNSVSMWRRAAQTPRTTNITWGTLKAAKRQ